MVAVPASVTLPPVELVPVAALKAHPRNYRAHPNDQLDHLARSLERLWPGVVTVDRRFRRPQHIVKDSWKRFDTPLKLKPGINLAALPPNDYGMRLVEKRPVKSERLRALVADTLAKD